MHAQGVEPGYIHVLRKLYATQFGQVKQDGCVSRRFAIERGTKQGDPLSSLLFNAVLEDVFRSVRPGWKKRRFGIEMSLGATSYLHSLCFADDVALFASNRFQMENMMKDIVNAAASKGLLVHPDKSKILTNAWAMSKRKVPSLLRAGGHCFEVLRHEGCVKYLGRKICFDDPHEVEFSSRIASAWAAFSKHKEELTDKRYRLQDRLKLFHATVTACVLYGCEAWVLRLEQQKRLRTTQRKMMRLILNAKRRKLHSSSDEDEDAEANEDLDREELEPWPEFLRRTARWAEEHLQAAGR
eukprot:12424261-Karenia_brevis.AAC.1